MRVVYEGGFSLFLAAFARKAGKSTGFPVQSQFWGFSFFVRRKEWLAKYRFLQ